MTIKRVTSDQVRVVSLQECIVVSNPPTLDVNSDPVAMKIQSATPSGLVSATTNEVNVPVYAAGTDLHLMCGDQNTQLLVVGGAYDGYYGFYNQVPV